jgi:hypothetical protein
MEEHSFAFTGEVWRWESEKASWFFVTLPLDTAEQIRFFFPLRRGFGSIPVQVQIGASRWRTSIFPDKRSGSFILPLKAPVRRAESFGEGDKISIEVTVSP